MKVLVLWAGGTLAFVALDMIWLGLVAARFYRNQLGGFVGVSDGRMEVNIPAALATWALIVLGIVVFVLPRTSQGGSVGAGLLWGALFGFVVYGVYDLTNLSVLRGWPVAMTAVDMAWGTFACGVTGALLTYAARLFH